MSATIEDIARRAGVSPGTVSRVLNGKNKENRPSIAQRAANIRQIAAELGYRPNSAARSILRGRFGLVAFVTCGDWGVDWFPRSLLHGIHQGLEAQGTRLVVHEVKAAKLADPSYVPSLLRESAVDGIIVHLDPRFSASVVPYLEAQNLPVVWTNHPLPRRSVYPDDLSAGEMLTEDLIRQGHKRIGYLAYSVAEPHHYSLQDRREGYRRAMGKAGLPLADCELPYPGEPLFGAVPMAGEFLKAHPECTAVVCYEIVEAISLCVAALEAGRRVPDDLRVSAFHEREVRSHTGIEVPTLIVPFYEVGMAAADMLHALIEGKQSGPKSVVVPYASVKY
jgi:DNA-binding LacI/PurR family transcriptional regulator